MKYFATDIATHIENGINSVLDSNENLEKQFYILPALPLNSIIELGTKLNNLLFSGTVRLQYKVAPEILPVNMTNPQFDLRWRCDSSLTDLRNSIPSSKNELLVVVLVGGDKVTDSASLDDFHYVDLTFVKQDILKSNYESWIERKFQDLTAYEKHPFVKQASEILDEIEAASIADLLQISNFLDALSLEFCSNGRVAVKHILTQLGGFNLPNMTGWGANCTKRFRDYIFAAIDFFNYNSFMETSKRNKALSKIRARREEGITFSDAELGSQFSNTTELLDTLEKYIQDNDQIAREKLFHAGFVAIQRRILDTALKTNGARAGIIKLTGSPVEMVLTALWDTLTIFQKENQLETQNNLNKIILTTREIKHDAISNSNDANSVRIETLSYFRNLLNGLDELIVQRTLTHSEGNSKIISNIVPPIMQDDDPINGITLTSVTSGEPQLIFEVKCKSSTGKDVKRRFAMRLPENHSWRISKLLVEEIIEQQRGQSNSLPVFTTAHFKELMLSKDYNETCRVFLQSIEKNISLNNLMNKFDISKDVLSEKVKNLCYIYWPFFKQIKQNGLLNSLFFSSNNMFDELRQQYTNTCEAYCANDESELGIMLYKAFLFLNEDDAHEPFKESVASGIVTILHPALLDMYSHSILYLFTSFNAKAALAFDTKFNKDTWRQSLELATVKKPLFGLIQNGAITTEVLGKDLIHQIGKTDKLKTALSSRLLLEYEDFEEENLTTKVMFGENGESLLIRKIIDDYCQIYPHASDGITLTFLTKNSLQPIVAAINSFIKDMKKQQKGVFAENYSITIKVLSDGNNPNIEYYIKEWLDVIKDCDTEASLAYYKGKHITISHMIVPFPIKIEVLKQKHLETDIFFLMKFIEASNNKDLRQVEKYNINNSTIKFPVLEKTLCAKISMQHNYERYRLISNRQFVMSAMHSEVMARIFRKDGSLEPYSKKDVIILGTSDFSIWKDVINEIHEKAAWVVCLDTGIDEELIRSKNHKREIIGFGSGAGAHGELNYTISTEMFAVDSIRKNLKAHFCDLFSDWDKIELDHVVNVIMNSGTQLSGLSLVKTTSVYKRFFREFAANALVRILCHNENVLCSEIISLDAYTHWFNFSQTGIDRKRPDLLWLCAIKKNGRIEIQASIIECKMAYQNDAHLEKAKEQLENGIATLVPNFMPCSQKNNVEEEDSKPDRRYWWLQLHRLIAGKVKTGKSNQEINTTISALERLADGDFTINWQAAVVTFWTDLEQENISAAQMHLDSDYISEAMHFEAGKSFISKLCLDSNKTFLDTIKKDNPFFTCNCCNTNIELTPETEFVDTLVSMPDNTVVKKTEIKNTTINIAEVKNKVEDINDRDNKKELTEPTIREMKSIPNRILLGTSNTNKPIYWEFGHNDLSNRHLLIFGTSGMGKTYAIQCILSELARKEQGTLVIDYTQGFSPDHIENVARNILNPKQHILRQKPLPMNPFKLQTQNFGGIKIPETISTLSKRVTSIFDTVYNIGDQQYSVLVNAIEQGIEEYQDLFSLDKLLKVIEEFSQDGTNKSNASKLYNKIRPFVMDTPFKVDGETDWNNIFYDFAHMCHIFQLAGMDSHSWKLVVEFVLWDLYSFLQINGDQMKPKVVVLDEVQNLDQDEQAPLAKYLREGRKFGISLIMATQIMSNLKKDEKDRLFNAAHKLFFRPVDTELKSYAEIASNYSGEKVNIWIDRLSSLQKGECYSIGSALNNANQLEKFPVKIKITSLEARFGESNA